MKRIIILLVLLFPLLLQAQVITYISGSAPVAASSPSYPSYWDTYASIIAITNTTDNLSLNGINVTNVNDLTSNNNDLIQADTSLSPDWTGSSILFDGVNDDIGIGTYALSQPITIYIYMKQVTWTMFDLIIRLADDPAYIQIQQSNAGTPNIRAYANGNVSASIADLALDTWGTVMLVLNGASSLIQVDDNTPETFDAGTQSLSYIQLGQGTGNIEVKAFVVTTQDDSSEQETAARSYFSGL